MMRRGGYEAIETIEVSMVQIWLFVIQRNREFLLK